MNTLSGRLVLGLLAASVLLPAQAPAPAAAQDSTQQLAQLNQQLTDSQARLDQLNNSVETAEAEAVNLNARLEDDKKRESQLQKEVAVLARAQYERPALSLTTILDATSLDQLLSDIAQSQLIAQKQWRLKIQAQELRSKDQKTRDEQAANTEKIKQARDQAAQVATNTLALRNKANDYLIDRALQASGKSFTGMKGFGTQDCAIQESMGPIADRSAEHLLACDAAIVKIRRLLLQTLKDHAAGKSLPGMDPASYRVRSGRFEAPKGEPFAEAMERYIRQDTPIAAE